MKWTFLALFTLTAGTTAAYGANSDDSPGVGRYQLGGTERDGLILIDTATGRTWKYSRDARVADGESAWIPLRFPEKHVPAAAGAPASPREAPAAAGVPAPPRQAPAEQSWFTPGPYRDKRPGGK